MPRKKKSPRPVGYTVQKHGKNLFDVTYDVGHRKLKDWEEWVLLSSDRHWDNPMSNWDLQTKHLEEALERGAGIIDAGDLFCAMQGKYDPRSSKSSVREIHQVPDYLDSLITTSTTFFEPYAQNFIVQACGNHESSIRKRHETDLIERFCATMKYKTGYKVHNGGYSGFVRFRLRAKGKTMGRLLTLHYSHGYGGGGPVTKGVIQSNRKAVYLPDADIVISGHVHESWQIELMRVRCGKRKIYHDSQLHVCLPTYKEEYKDGFGGWHVERGAPPKPIGACWLRLYYDAARIDGHNSLPRGLSYQIIKTGG